MSSRGTVEGSGRSNAAEKDAFAMARWWEAISRIAHSIAFLLDVEGSSEAACGEVRSPKSRCMHVTDA